MKKISIFLALLLFAIVSHAQVKKKGNTIKTELKKPKDTILFINNQDKLNSSGLLFGMISNNQTMNYLLVESQASSKRKKLNEKIFKPLDSTKIIKIVDTKFNENGNEIWLYEDINFDGTLKIITIQKGKLYSLNDLGIDWNDKISSIKFPKNCGIILFENDNLPYEGNKIAISTFGNNNLYFNDLSVLKKTELYGYSNEYKTEIIDYNDKISSIYIGSK